MTLTPYLNMTGNAEEAISLYKRVFGGTVEIRRWNEMPPNEKMPLPDGWEQKVMHGMLTMTDGIGIYISDSLTDDSAPVNNTVFLHVTFDSEDALRKAYDALSEGGHVNMPVDRTFWGSVYGDLVDRFGVGWGLEYELPQ